MQQPTASGLRPASEAARRWTIVPIYNASEMFARSLEEMWAKRTPAEALAVLSKPDVTVTNQGDKDMQLPKILTLNKQVRKVMEGTGAQQEGAPVAGAEVSIDVNPGGMWATFREDGGEVKQDV